LLQFAAAAFLILISGVRDAQKRDKSGENPRRAFAAVKSGVIRNYRAWNSSLLALNIISKN